MKLKKLLILPIILILLSAPVSMLAGCGCFSVSGTAPDRAQLVGRWQLTQTRYRGNIGSGRTFAPGSTAHPGWSGGYFIEFFENGTFSEQNFWNLDGTRLSGTFILEGNSLKLTTTGTQDEWEFVGTRHVGISSDGNTLTMTYTRNQGAAWHYLHTFTRVNNGDLDVF